MIRFYTANDRHWLFVAAYVLNLWVSPQPSAWAQVGSDSSATPIAASTLARAHAHNDYEHNRPLLDSLELGFTSIEADVFLVNGKLLVAHHILLVNKQRTLESLYLEPLWKRFQEQHGAVLPGGVSLTLLIDIKRDGAIAYAALEKLLVKYREMLSVTVNGEFKQGAVTVVISGDRPIEQIKRSNPRFVGIDGRLGDLDSQEPASLVPLVSENWNNLFEFRGVGTMSENERLKLRQLVSRAHARSRRLRFWGTPDYEKMWRELYDADVDWIGTDDLSRLARFLKENSQ